jgi:hypothetical protein
MRMKKYAAALALAAALCVQPSLLSPQEAQAGASGPADPASAADVAVLLDLSQSVLPYFQDVTDYVVSSVVRDYLRSGDSFHLLSFGETTQAEIAQRMSSEGDVKSVLGRLYLLYPLARYTDFAGALGYLYQYLSDLPSGRPKVVVIITDGIHNPPSSSPTYGLSDDKVTAEIEASASRIRANGWPVHIIKLPFAAAAEGATPAQARDADGRSFLDAAAKALGAPVSEFHSEGKEGLAVKTLGIPTAEFPGDLGKRDYAFSFPLRVTNGSQAPVGLELTRASVGGEDVLERKAFLSLQPGKSGTMKVPVVLPDSIPEGERSLRIELSFANGVRVSPREGTLTLTLARSPLGAVFRSGARVVLFTVILALGLAAVVALFLILRGAGKRAQAPIMAAVLGADAGSGARADDASVLRGAAARSESDRRARESVAEGSAAAMAEARRAEAIRDAQLLADAAGVRESAPTARKPSRKTAAQSGASAQGLDREAYEASVEQSAQAIAAERKAEAERSAALLAAAMPRHAPPAPQPASRVGSAAFAYESRVVKAGSTRIELKVDEQNPHIGLRNVHSVRAGAVKSVGGGSSDFLVFLVPVPRHVADLHFDGEKLAFVPRRPEFFPELAGPVEDCIGKEISMVSSSGYPLTLRFEAYEEPEKSINRLLHCIDMPGLF